MGIHYMLNKAYYSIKFSPETVRSIFVTTIGVLSDTHLRSISPEQRQTLEHHLANVDLILHAGDITSQLVLDTLPASTVLAVRGNSDDYVLSQTLPEQLVTEVDGFKIGLIHGWGPPDGLTGRVRTRFNHVDCIVFGHSHQPCNQVEDGVLFFNPGSFSRNRDYTGRGSLGIIMVDQRLEGRIITL